MTSVLVTLLGAYLFFGAVLAIRNARRDRQRMAHHTTATPPKIPKTIVRLKCVDGSTREEDIDYSLVGEFIRSQIIASAVAHAHAEILMANGEPSMTMVELLGGPGDGRRWPWPKMKDDLVFTKTFEGVTVSGKYQDSHEWRQRDSGMVRIFRCVGVDYE